MKKDSDERWLGLNQSARAALVSRDYADGALAERLKNAGVSAEELAALDCRTDEVRQFWIAGVEIFSRNVFRQRHRGLFGEFVRQQEGVLSEIGLWPKQWAAARMFAHAVKGFHIHPPSIPNGVSAQDWHRRLFIDEPQKYVLRRYDDEQWDVMFFVQGRIEMILRDVRDGLEPKIMRFYIDGDNHPGASNVGVIIPPGVAHALRVEGSEDAVMVYGTSTSFHPECEGRIASEIETAQLPESWQRFLAGK